MSADATPVYSHMAYHSAVIATPAHSEGIAAEAHNASRRGPGNTHCHSTNSVSLVAPSGRRRQPGEFSQFRGRGPASEEAQGPEAPRRLPACKCARDFGELSGNRDTEAQYLSLAGRILWSGRPVPKIPRVSIALSRFAKSQPDAMMRDVAPSDTKALLKESDFVGPSSLALSVSIKWLWRDLPRPRFSP